MARLVVAPLPDDSSPLSLLFACFARDTLRLTRASQSSNLLDQFLPLDVGSVIVVLVRPLVSLWLARGALSGRASSQQGDLIHHILHLVRERMYFLATLSHRFRADVTKLLLLLLAFLVRFEASSMLQSFSVTPPFGDGRVSSRRGVSIAQRTGVTRLNEAQRTATLLIAEIAGALVSEQRRFLRISSAASATDQAQFRLDFATVLWRPVLIGAARRRRQSHRFQAWMVRVLLQECLHQRARHLDLGAPFHVQRH